jgi:hypothetical protein
MTKFIQLTGTDNTPRYVQSYAIAAFLTSAEYKPFTEIMLADAGDSILVTETCEEAMQAIATADNIEDERHYDLLTRVRFAASGATPEAE